MGEPGILHMGCLVCRVIAKEDDEVCGLVGLKFAINKMRKNESCVGDPEIAQDKRELSLRTRPQPRQKRSPRTIEIV